MWKLAAHLHNRIQIKSIENGEPVLYEFVRVYRLWFSSWDASWLHAVTVYTEQMHSKIRELADIPPNQRKDYFGVILLELFSARMKSNFSIAHTNGGTDDSRSFYIA